MSSGSMRWLAAPALATALAIGASPARAQQELRGLDAYIEKAMKDFGVAGMSVAIVKDGGVIYAKGFGVRDASAGGAVDENTLFAIGSNSKLFTAVAAGMLVDEKKMDWDGKIRMDPSSPYAMARLIGLRDRFDLAFATDPDADRHGIVTRSAGLLNPNHYLAASIWHLFRHRLGWPGTAAVGKTIVSSSMIDRVAARIGRRLVEVPVGFKYFVEGLLDASLGFAGEESAGASFLRLDGTVWVTDKDGIIPALLAAEITARTSRDPGEI